MTEIVTIDHTNIPVSLQEKVAYDMLLEEYLTMLQLKHIDYNAATLQEKTSFNEQRSAVKSHIISLVRKITNTTEKLRKEQR